MTAKRRARKPSAARRGGRRRTSVLLLLLLLAAAFWGAWNFLGPGPASKPTTVVLEKGAGTPAIAAELAKDGVIRSQVLFIAAAKLGGGSLKAGEYAIPRGASVAKILSDLRAGRVVRHFVTVPEGWTSAMAAEAVEREPVLTGQAAAPSEGVLLPETYEVSRGEDRATVLARMADAQSKLLARLWPARRPGLPFATPEEAVALASIVEKETAVPAERARIAAVYINRLRSGMRLESDPTTIYGITAGRPLGRGLTRADLTAANPYNTYQITGLPPTPIANPGRASIEAVLNPPQTSELFFVANGQGGHAFASTFAEHQKNVAHWREIEHERQAAQAGAAALPGKAG